jgi:hypothetical protein
MINLSNIGTFARDNQLVSMMGLIMGILVVFAQNFTRFGIS